MNNVFGQRRGGRVDHERWTSTAINYVISRDGLVLATDSKSGGLISKP